MLVIHSIQELQTTLTKHRQAGHSIGLVPTMGNLHQGHLQLVKTAQQHANVVIVSLFVNPTQFGANEDLDSYPRTFQEDINKLEALGTDILFAPTVDEIYPLGGGNTSHVHVPDITTVLCGASRPGHFNGVTTIVNKLFNITRADTAVFGEKDWQQLAVIRRMVIDLNIPINIVGEPIVREADGLAMSSRNGYLSADQRHLAPALHACLQGIKKALTTGSTELATLKEKATSQLNSAGFRVDYLDILNPLTLSAPAADDKEFIILVAAFVGETRLIDNLYIKLI